MISPVSICCATAVLAISAMASPYYSRRPAENGYMGLAWEAAAASVNVGNNGKFWVPIEIADASRNGIVTTLEVVFQQSWCSPDEGNDLDDVCESMCPVYYGGDKATYRIFATESNGSTDFESKRIE